MSGYLASFHKLFQVGLKTILVWVRLGKKLKPVLVLNFKLKITCEGI